MCAKHHVKGTSIPVAILGLTLVPSPIMATRLVDASMPAAASAAQITPTAAGAVMFTEVYVTASKTEEKARGDEMDYDSQQMSVASISPAVQRQTELDVLALLNDGTH